MKSQTFPCSTAVDLEKPFSYAKRLLEVAKFGIVVNVSQKKLQRSTNQNRYYWGVVLKQMSDETGYTPEELHTILGIEYRKIGEIEINGKTYPQIISTTKYKTDEFEEYLEKCRMYASINMNIVILLPNETEFSY